MYNLCPEFKLKLEQQGYEYSAVGSLMDPTGTKLYAAIPKNASSFMSEILWKSGWIHTNEEVKVIFRLKKDSSVVSEVDVVLRDPIERWISGISQYAMSHLLAQAEGYLPTEELFHKYYNHIVEEILFSTVAFDDHTLPQYYFIQDIYPEMPRKYFYFDDSLTETVIRELKLNPNDIPEDKKNINVEINDKTDSRVRKRAIVQFFTELVHDNKHLRDKLIDFYRADYALINSADFINK